MEDIITVKNLAYAYPDLDGQKGTRVFENLNLTIESGSFVAILGTNGCGKSTLAKHFNSILLPSGGKVYVDGIDTRSLPTWWRRTWPLARRIWVWQPRRSAAG